jgi:hypothetical protein
MTTLITILATIGALCVVSTMLLLGIAFLSRKTPENMERGEH